MRASEPRKTVQHLHIEELEPRVAPVVLAGNGGTFTFTDGDGDLVRVTFSNGSNGVKVRILGAAGGDPGTSGNPYITTIDFYQSNSSNTTLLVDVIGGSGDGLTPAGVITTGNNQNSVGSILVQGPITSFTGPEIANLRSDYDGAVAAIGDVNVTSTKVNFTGTICGNSSIGSVTIANSLIGSILCGTTIGSVTVGGSSGITSTASITAGGALSGTISATAGPIAGSILVGSITSTGEIKTSAAGQGITGTVTVNGDMAGKITSSGGLGSVTVTGAGGITSAASITASGALSGTVSATAGPIAGSITVGSITSSGAIKTTASSGQSITGAIVVNGDMAGQIISTRHITGGVTIIGNMTATGIITAGSASLPGDMRDVTANGTTGIVSGAQITAYGILRGWISAPNGANNGTINVGGFESVTTWTLDWYKETTLAWSDTFTDARFLVSKNPNNVDAQGFSDTIYYSGNFKTGTGADETVYGDVRFDGWYMIMDGWRLVMHTDGSCGFIPGQGGVTTPLSLGIDFTQTPSFDLNAFNAIDATVKTTDKYYFSVYIAGGAVPLGMTLAGQMVIPNVGTMGKTLHWDPIFEPPTSPTPPMDALLRTMWRMALSRGFLRQLNTVKPGADNAVLTALKASLPKTFVAASWDSILVRLAQSPVYRSITASPARGGGSLNLTSFQTGLGAILASLVK